MYIDDRWLLDEEVHTYTQTRLTQDLPLRLHDEPDLESGI